MNTSAFTCLFSFLLLSPSSLPTAANAALRIFLSAVCLTSGVGKFCDLAGTRQAMTDFGVPPRGVFLASWLLPSIEVALALAVLLDPISGLACWAASLLFLAFSAGIGNLIRKGQAPPCHCFGAVHSAPVTTGTLQRALALSVVAAIGGNLPTYPITADPLHLTITLIALPLAALGIARFAANKTNSRSGLRAGQRIPGVRLANGEWLKQVLPRQQTLLVIMSPTCLACRALEAPLSAWAVSFAESLAIVRLHLQGPKDMEPAGASDYFLSVAEFLQFRSATPGGILIDETGLILSPPVAGQEEIEALIRVTATNRRALPAPLE